MYHHMKSKQEQNNTIDNDGDAVEWGHDERQWISNQSSLK
jgi:hypothetical protein